jgi:3-hydroxyacyl-[acyl-carrier-protein] dehydratase
MHFSLVDRVLEASPDRIVTLKLVTCAEEYLRDHFPTFPVLPGVLMIEALTQAARELLRRRGIAHRLVLGGVRAVKYGAFVRPGATLRVEVQIAQTPSPDGAWDCRGHAVLLDPQAPPDLDPPQAVSGRFTMRPVRMGTARASA